MLTLQAGTMSPARFLARICRGNSLRAALRRCVGGTMIAAYVVVAAGVPLPAIREPAKGGELFPCASCGCGCDSAEQCWQNCCCHTLAERLAWAEKNGVKPPAFAIAAAKLAGLDAGGRPLTARVVKLTLAAKSCCHAKRDCCKSSAAKHTCCSSHEESKPEIDAANFVVAYRALGCHGQFFNWLAAVPTLISVERELTDRLALVDWLGPHSSAVAGGVTDVPTPPPPERA